MDAPTCDWIGKSGTKYRYWVYALPAGFNEGQPGNYIWAKKNAQGYWVPIYIGQGDLQQRLSNHHQRRCIQQKGATHFHCHTNASEWGRLSEEDDLLANYTNAYHSDGCNERKGG